MTDSDPNPDQTLFADAMALHQRYCNRPNNTHQCPGQTTIRRGEVCLECPLCGPATHHPWNPQQVLLATDVLNAAGIRWDALNRENQSAVLQLLDERSKSHSQQLCPQL